jgi:hypothetical protein
VVVHQDCLDKFYQQLMDEQWNEDMAAAAAAAAAATLK